MTYLHYQLDPREAAYGRLVANVLGTLRRAVAKRVQEGQEKGAIAKRADLSPGHLSRVLNGNVSNVTLRTVSDLLWATDFDPKDFGADAIEDISSNGLSSSVKSTTAPKSGDIYPIASTKGKTYSLTPKSGLMSISSSK